MNSSTQLSRDRTAIFMEKVEEPTILRCRRCRKCLIDSTCLLPIVASGDAAATCSVWHMNVDVLPDWIVTAVHQVHWTVGKLNCQYCGARLGGFNFVNNTKCPCGHDATVHLSKSRVDHDHRRSVHLARPVRARGRGDRLDAESGPESPQHELMGREVREVCWAGSQHSSAAVSSPRGDLRPDILCPETGLWRNDFQATQSAALCLPLPASHRRSDLSCSTDPSQSRPLDEAGDESVGEVRSGKEPLPSPLMGTIPILPLAAGTAETDTGWTGENSAPGRPWPLESRDQQDYLLPSGGTLQPGEPVPMCPSSLRRRVPSDRSLEQEDWGSAIRPLEEPFISTTSPAEQRLSKREKNHLKSQRRKRRKKECWIRSQMEENEQSLKGNLSSSDDEDREGYTCAVCLEVYFSPYMCHPCSHVFCEPCLRTLAKNRPSSTLCPLCRTVISHVLFQKELNQTTKDYFPKEYRSRKQTLQRTNYAKWPLPSCPKRFGIFWGLQRDSVPAGRWHRAFGLDALDLVDTRGWPFDMIIYIYIYSGHWVLAFIILCFLGCYLF